MRLQSTWAPRLAPGPGSLPDRLAAAVAEDIESGLLMAGDRLPPQRQVAESLKTSLVTVGKAFAQLEGRGLVRGEHGRGTFVSSGGEVSESHRNLAARGPEAPDTRQELVADLSLNLPPALMPATAMADVVADLSRRNALPDANTYPPCAGWGALRAEAAAWLRRQRPGAPTEGLLMTNGAQQAISVAFAMASAPGKPLIAEAVTFPGAIAAAAMLGRRMIGVALDDEGMVPDSLDRALAAHPGAAVYVVPQMQNPTAATMGEERRRAVLAVCRRHGAQVIEDDAYAVLDPTPPPTLARLDPERVWYITSFTKPLTALLRVGALVPPRGREADGVRGIQGTTWTTAPLHAAILLEWLRNGTADAQIPLLRAEANARATLARRLLPGVCRQGHGAFHIWLPLAEAAAERFARRAEAAGVRLTPPLATVVDPALAMGVRLCLGAPSMEALEQALAILAGLRVSNMPEVL